MTRKSSHSITRRGFVVGSAAAAATAATAAIALDGCSSSSASAELIESVQAQFPSAQVEYLEVAASQVLPHTDMNNVESAAVLFEASSFSLPLGSLVYQSSDTQALVMTPGDSSKTLIGLGFVQLDGGSYASILSGALGAGEDYVIYDARASASAVAWVECNMVHGLWRVYATALQNGAVSQEIMQQAVLLDEGEGSYVPPQLAVCNNKVYWTVMPDPDGAASSEDSYLKATEISAAKAGGTAEATEPRVVYTSHGRMITNPQVSGSILTFVPRVDTDNVYYQLTALDTQSDSVLNIAILPPSLRVSDAVWLDSGFAFGIEGNYDYAEGLSLFGTYQQLGEGQFLYVNKMPSSAAAQVTALTFVKSTKNILGIDPRGGSVAIVDTPQDSVVYGDILAGVGTQSRLVLYTTVTPRVGKSTGVCRVRVLDPV